MPRQFLRRWYRLDLFAALERLYSFVARREPITSDSGKPVYSKPELNTLELRNPPSEMLFNVVLPLSVTAATLAAQDYFDAARADAEERAAAAAGAATTAGADSGHELAHGGRYFGSSAHWPAEAAPVGPQTITSDDEGIAGYGRAGGVGDLDEFIGGSALDYLPSTGWTAGDNDSHKGNAGGDGGAAGSSAGLPGTDGFADSPMPLEMDSGTGFTGDSRPGQAIDDLSSQDIQESNGGETDGPAGRPAPGAESESRVPSSLDLGTLPPSTPHASTGPGFPTPPPTLRGNTSGAPIRFVTNAGQWNESIDFGVRGDGYQAWFTGGNAVIALAKSGPGAAGTPAAVAFDTIRMTWEGITPTTAVGEDRLSSVSNYFIGNDPSAWRTNVSEYGAVRYSGAWEGVDLLYRRADSTGLEYDLVVAPGASPAAASFRVEGASASVDGEGRLVLTTPSGSELVQHAPVVYQLDAGGDRQVVSGGYRLRADGTVGFALGAYDATRELVIDPVLSYDTILGGSGTDEALAVTSDADGNAYAVGVTIGPQSDPTDFPTTTGAYDTTWGDNGSYSDGFVTKLGPTGSIIWSTYLGGVSSGSPFGLEAVYGVAIGAGGNVYVTGDTPNTDFPHTSGAYQEAREGTNSYPYDAFVSVLSANGSSLVYSTFLGGTGNDQARAIAIDSETEEVVIVGSTSPGSGDNDFPLQSAAQPSPSLSGDAFVTRFPDDLSSLVFSTYLGGDSTETAYGVAVDSTGDAIVVGGTSSSDFPDSGGYDGSLAGSSDAFLTRFSSGGSREASTYYGGSGAEAARGTAVDNLDRIYVTGIDATGSGFTARFGSLGSAPAYDTGDGGNGIAVDSQSRAVVVGTSGGSIAVTRYASDGASVDWSTTWGSSSAAGYAAAVDPDDNIYAAGSDGAGNAVVLKYEETLVPVITGMSDDTGASNSDRVTMDSTPTVFGTSEANATITLYRQEPSDPSPVSAGTTTASGAGLWTFTYSPALADAAYQFTATATVGGITSGSSNVLTVTVDTTDPDVSVSVDSPTYSVKPPVVVFASDLVGFPTPATVTLDIDLDNNGSFLDQVSGTLSNGSVTFTNYPSLTPGTTAAFKARITDLAGNEGTSATATVEVQSVANPWTVVDATRDLRSDYSLLGMGDVTTQHMLDLDVSAYACDCQDPYLVYHSQEAAPAPVVQAVLQSDNALGLPSHVYGTLTWDGASAGGVDYSLSQLTPGGQWVLSFAPGGSPATGRHTYSLDLFVDYAGSANDHPITMVGDTFVVNRSASPYGAGWSFSNTDSLVSISASGSYPAGMLRLYGKGGWGFYESTGGGQFNEPPGDAGSLVVSGSGWTYSSDSGRVLQFDSSGRQTTWTHVGSGETLTYTYDASGGVATMKGPDGGTATFAYSASKLATITAPGNRVTTMAYSGTDLTQITDPAGGTHTFAYASHRLTSETFGAAKSSFAYDAFGLPSSITLGATSTLSVGLKAGLGAGSTAGPWNSVIATLTNALGNTWSTWFNSFGQPVKTLDPVGAVRLFERDADGFVVKYTDSLNRLTTYTVDAAGRILGETRPDGSSASWRYNGAFSSLTGYTDYKTTGIWTYTNDANGNRLTATDPLNHTTTYTYENGLLKTEKDATGNVTTYLYDASRRPIGALLGGAPTGTTGYDSRGNPNSYTDPRGNVTTSTYDGVGRVIGTLDPLLKQTTSSYDAGGFLLWTSDEHGHITSYAYDSAGRVVAVIEAYGTSLERRTTSVYDAAGQLITTIDPLTRRTTIEYDAAGRVVATVDALGNRTTTVYNLESEVVATKDPLGRVTQYDYDLLGRQVELTDAASKVWTTQYDANSNVTGTIDPLGHKTTSMSYDKADRLTASDDALGNRTSYDYWDDNQLRSVTDPRGKITTTTYDSRNRVWFVDDARNKRTTFGYDAADNRTTVTDPLNHTSTTGYDKLNRANEFTDGEGNLSTIVYDAAGLVEASVDPRGNRTTTVYDALHRPVETIDALGKRTTAIYDAADQLTATVDPKGNRTSYTYYDNGLLKETIDAKSNRTTSLYDAASQLTTTWNALNQRTTFGYDAVGRMVTTTDALGHTWTTGYDAAGRMITATDPNNHTTTTHFDIADRVWSIEDARGMRTTFGYDAASNQNSVTNARGKITTTNYDALNRVEEIIDAKLNRTTYTYDDAGNLKTVKDARNNTTTYDYDKADRMITLTDAAGKVWTTAYDPASNVLSTTDPLNRTTQYVYDELNRVKVMVDPLGKRTTSTYDFAGNLETVKDARNNLTTYTYDVRNLHETTIDAKSKVWTTVYDALGRAIASIDPLGNRTDITFDAAGRIEENIDALGKRTTTIYDPAGNVLATVDARQNRTSYTYYDDDRVKTVKDAKQGVVTTTYDEVGNVKTVADQRNKVTTYAYDELDRRITVTDAAGEVWTTTYDEVGNVKESIDPLGHITTTLYDALNRVKEVQDALQNRTTTLYDAAGQVETTIDQLGKRTTFTYEVRGLLETMKDPLGNVTTTTYDEVGNVKTVKNPRGFVTTSTYDVLNRLETTADALGKVWTIVYDDVGNAIARVDPLGERTTTVFDALNRVWATEDALGHRNTTTYDAVGNIETTADGLNKITTYGYDELNRLISTTDPRLTTTTYDYDAAGNRTVLVDASGNRTTWVYDNLNRVTTETNPFGANATFAYDDAGRLSSETDRLGRRKDYDYYDNNLLKTEKWYTGGSPVQTQTWTYDAVGRVLTAQDPDGTYTLAYDAKGQVTSVQEPFSLILTMTYDENGNRLSVNDSKGNTRTTMTFDALDRQTSEKIDWVTAVPIRFDYLYTDRGEIERIRRYNDLTGTSLVVRTDYTYDDAGRLTNLKNLTAAGSTTGSYSYDYDAADRLTQKIEGANTYTYAYDVADQLTVDDTTTFGYDATGNRTNSGYATDRNRITNDGTWTYTYDGEGNLTKRSKGASAETWNFTYDHNNQMLTAARSNTDGGAVNQRVTYAYDSWGNRIQRLEWTGGSTTTTRYGLDGWDPAKAGADGTANFDVWVRLDQTNTLTARFLHGTRLDEVIARQTSTATTQWFLNDNQGSVRRVVNNSAVLQESTQYSAYGEVISGAVYGGYGYTGREHDAIIGGGGDAWYLRSRIFLPSIGRFTSEDAKGFAAGDTNLFRYVYNSPTNATDPSGLDYLKIEGQGKVVWVTTKLTFWKSNGLGQDVIYFPIGTVYSNDIVQLSEYGGSGTVEYKELDMMVAYGRGRTSPPRTYRGYGDQNMQHQTILSELRQLKSYKPAAGSGAQPILPRPDYEPPKIQAAPEPSRPQPLKGVPPNPEFVARAKETLNETIAEWRKKEWDYAATLLQHFLDASGRKHAVTQGQHAADIVRTESYEAVHGLIRKYRPIGLPKEGATFTIGKAPGISTPLHIYFYSDPGESLFGAFYGKQKREEFNDTFLNNQLFYAFGGVDIYIEGKITNVKDGKNIIIPPNPRSMDTPRARVLCVTTFDVEATVQFTDTYTFPGGIRQISDRYAMAHYLELVGVAKKFDVSVQFKGVYTGFRYIETPNERRLRP